MPRFIGAAKRFKGAYDLADAVANLVVTHGGKIFVGKVNNGVNAGNERLQLVVNGIRLALDRAAEVIA